MKKGKKLIVGNWKMNPARWDEGKGLLLGIRKGVMRLKGGKAPEFVICPPNLYLRDAVKAAGKTKLSFGVQDVSPFDGTGSKTGSISALMHRNSGAKSAIIGHSERRQAGESDDEVNRKIHLALGAGLRAIVCIGEKERHANGDYLEFIRTQLRLALEKVERKDLANIAIAYEPVWAIGAKEAMTPHDLHQMSLYIRKILIELYSAEATGIIPVLYGGAVSPENALGIVRDGAVDGLLVGRDSLNAANFVEIGRLAAMA